MTRDFPFTLWFDGECPICRREVDWLRARDKHGRLRAIDIAAPSFDARVFGLDRAALEARLHGRHADGRIVTGMAAMRGAWQAIGRGWLIAPTGWPILRWFFDRAYDVFARHRIRIGRWFGRKDCTTDRCST